MLLPYIFCGLHGEVFAADAKRGTKIDLGDKKTPVELLPSCRSTFAYKEKP